MNDRVWLFKSAAHPPVTVAIVQDRRVLWATYGPAKAAGQPSVEIAESEFPDHAGAMTACSGMVLFEQGDLLAAAMRAFVGTEAEA